MKRNIIILALFIHTTFSYAQYDKDKLIKILIANSWSVKGSGAELPEKSFVFSKDMTVQTGKENGKGAVESQKQNWTISSSDQIRWFISIGNRSYELIISYTKSGSQYVKLIHQDKIQATYEMNLYPFK